MQTTQAQSSAGTPLSPPRHQRAVYDHCYPSGHQNISETLRTDPLWGDCACCCYHPCCIQRITKTWEDERDACYEKNFTRCLSRALCNRICHVTSCILDTSGAACLPLYCAISFLHGTFWSCRSLALRTCLPCVNTEEEHRELNGSIFKAENFAKKIFYMCATNGCALGAVAIIDIIKCPFNVVGPEACNWLVFQQECYAQENLWYDAAREPPC